MGTYRDWRVAIASRQRTNIVVSFGTLGQFRWKWAAYALVTRETIVNYMKHGQNSRRGRSRGNNGRRNSSPRNQTFDSNGPEGKVRGTPQQILDKYLSLARDAASAGEHISAEAFYQFAEHYFRILNADQQARQRQEQQEQNQADAEESANEAGAQNTEQNAEQRPEQNAEGANDSDGAPSGDQDNDQSRGRRSRGNNRRRKNAESGDAEVVEIVAKEDAETSADAADPAENAVPV